MKTESIKNFEKAVELIDLNGGGDFEGRKSTAVIDAAEGALGLRFPPTYRKFLATLGCGDIAGLEFFGVIDDNFFSGSIPDAIWLTLDERKSGLPDNFILIYATGTGEYYALDTSQIDSDGESPVVSCGLDGNTSQIAESFGSFFLSELNTMLS